MNAAARVRGLIQSLAPRFPGRNNGSAITLSPPPTVVGPGPIAKASRTKVARPKTEREVVALALRLIGDLEPSLGPIRHLATEVRTHGRSRADILLLADDLVSVEAKLADWRRAFGQAVLNTTVVDRSYVAMWSGHIAEALIEAAEEHGIGVIEVHPDGLEIVIKAIPGTPNEAAHRLVLQRLADQVTKAEDAT